MGKFSSRRNLKVGSSTSAKDKNLHLNVGKTFLPEGYTAYQFYVLQCGETTHLLMAVMAFMKPQVIHQQKCSAVLYKLGVKETCAD